MSTTGASDDRNKTCRNIAIVFCVIAVIGVIIIISLFIWNFAFRYKDKGGNLSPVECQQLNGVNLQDFCYVPSSDQLPWQKAEDQCVKKSGHLASIPSDQVNTGVTAQFMKTWPNATDSWIGLNDMGQVSVYRYSDGSNVTYTNWAASALTLLPSDAAARRCASISGGKTPSDNATSGQWVKHDCGTSYYYICRYALATAPFPPRSVAATPIAGGAHVNWQVPEKDGGKPVLNYTITSWPDMKNVTISGTSADVTGLHPYINYTFTVRATNVVGSSASSDPSNPVIAGVTSPDPPTDVVGKPGPSSVIISFTPPQSDGGSILLRYEVSIAGSGLNVQKFIIANNQAPSNTVTYTGLPNDVSVNLQILAVNNNSLSSTPVIVGSVIPNALVPATPTNFFASAYYRNITLTWDQPAGIVTQYNITASYMDSETLINLPVTVVSPSTRNYTFTGLVIRTEYTFFIIAINTNGASAPSLPAYNTTFPIAPGVPRNVMASAADRSALVTFIPPLDDGGAAIIGFTVKSNVTTVPNTTIVVAELINSTTTYSISVPNLTSATPYTFRVLAYSSVGESQFSLDSNVVYPLSGSPDPPVNVVAVAIGQGARISFQPGANDGGDPVDSYIIFAHPGSFNMTFSAATTTNLEVKILLVGVNYTFTVVAHNVNGNSMHSAFSNVAIPYAVVPGAPLSVMATPGPQAATVTWQPPSNDGGIPITSYEISSTPGNVTVNISVNANTTLQTVITHLWNVKLNYTFQVRAANPVGRGPLSDPSLGIIVNATFPDPPVNVKVKASFSGAEVSFQSPYNDGGADILRYIAVSNPTTRNFTDSNSPIDVKDLDSKTTYIFVVYAENALGRSAASLPSEPFKRSDAIFKDNAVPIAGGIILALLLIVGIIIGLFICKNTEKCCWAREGGSTTADKKPEPQATTVDLEENPKTEPIALGQSSSGYDVSSEPKETTQDVS